MRKWVTLCLDKITSGYMVLSETSYNNACFYLEQNGFECDTTESINDRYTKIIGKVKGKPAEFIYDEHRGYLVMID